MGGDLIQTLICPGSYNPWVVGLSPGVCDVDLNGVIFEKRIYVLNLTVTPDPGIACVGDDMTFVATGEPDGGTYSWSAPGGSPSSGSGRSFTTHYSIKGTNTVTCVYNFEYGSCTKTITAKSVAVGAVTTLTPFACKGDSITFTPLSDPAGGFPPNAPEWLLIKGDGSLSNATGPTTTFTPNATYVGDVVVTANCGNEDSGALGKAQLVKVDSVTHDLDIICVGEVVTFTAQSSGGGFPAGAPEWSVSGPGQILQNNGASITVKATGADYIIAKARCNKNDSFAPDIVPAVIVDKIQYLDDDGDWQDLPDDLSVCQGESMTFKAIASPDVGFPDGQPQWEGQPGFETGEIVSFSFSGVGRQSISVHCDDSPSVDFNVVVGRLAAISSSCSGTSMGSTKSTWNIEAGVTMFFTALIDSGGAPFDGNKIEWSGSASGFGLTNMVNFSNPGTYSVTESCGANSVTVNINVLASYNLGMIQNKADIDPDFFSADSIHVVVGESMQWRCQPTSTLSVVDCLSVNLAWAIYFDVPPFQTPEAKGIDSEFTFAAPIQAFYRCYVFQDLTGVEIPNTTQIFGSGIVSIASFQAKNLKIQKVSVAFSTLTPLQTSAQVQTILDDCTMKIKRRDKEADHRACAKFTVDFVTTFTPSADMPDPITSLNDYKKLVANGNVRIRRVSDITYINANGLTTVGVANSTVVRNSTSGTWVHEMGHGVGIDGDYTNGDTDAVMYFQAGGARNILIDNSECDAYEK